MFKKDIYYENNKSINTQTNQKCTYSLQTWYVSACVCVRACVIQNCCLH